MNTLIRWAVTAALVLVGAFGLLVAISGFAQSAPGWAIVGLLVLAFAYVLQQWLEHAWPAADELPVYKRDGGAVER